MHFDATDLDLVNALQIAPRASWREIHAATGIDPSTSAQRWARLSSQGLAWVTGYPTRSLARTATAYVEVDCSPGSRDSAIRELSKDSNTLSIECTTGKRDLFLTVEMADIASIDHYISTRVGLVPGVRSTRTHHVRRIFTEGAAWRLGTLPAQQQQRLQASRTPAVREGDDFTDTEWRIVAEMGQDGRRSATAIAEVLGTSVSTVSRAIAKLFATGRVSMRCDIAHNLSPWNVMAVLWLSVPHDQVKPIADVLAASPQLRQVSSLASEANLMIQLWMRSLNEMDTIESTLATRFPTTRVLDRWVVSQNPKRFGHLIDESGRRRGFQPLPRPVGPA